MKFINLILIALLSSFESNAQTWKVFERTSNDLLFISNVTAQIDTLFISAEKQYEILIEGLSAEEQQQNRIILKNPFESNEVRTEVKNQVTIVDFADTLYTTKLLIDVDNVQQVQNRPFYYVVVNQQSKDFKTLYFKLESPAIKRLSFSSGD